MRERSFLFGLILVGSFARLALLNLAQHRVGDDTPKEGCGITDDPDGDIT